VGATSRCQSNLRGTQDSHGQTCGCVERNYEGGRNSTLGGSQLPSNRSTCCLQKLAGKIFEMSFSRQCLRGAFTLQVSAADDTKQGKSSFSKRGQYFTSGGWWQYPVF